MIITIDLKNKEATNIRRYATYGDEFYLTTSVDQVKEALESKANFDGLTALRAVLAHQDNLFQIRRMYITAPPGVMSIETASGWEYDW